jgi:hypothetical protein
MKNLAIWQIYFDDESLNELDKGFIPYSNENKATEFFENDVIIDVWRNHKHIWEKADYVGVLSWRFREKTNITSLDVVKRANEIDTDVISMSPTTLNNVKSSLNLIFNEMCKIIDKYDILPMRMTKQDCDSRGELRNYCNFFICKPNVFDDYVKNYLYPLREFLNDCKDEDLAWILREKRTMHRGKPHLIHTFFLESLFERYVEHKKCSYKVIENNGFYKLDKQGFRAFLNTTQKR